MTFNGHPLILKLVKNHHSENQTGVVAGPGSSSQHQHHCPRWKVIRGMNTVRKILNLRQPKIAVLQHLRRQDQPLNLSKSRIPKSAISKMHLISWKGNSKQQLQRRTTSCISLKNKFRTVQLQQPRYCMGSRLILRTRSTKPCNIQKHDLPPQLTIYLKACFHRGATRRGPADRDDISLHSDSDK